MPTGLPRKSTTCKKYCFFDTIEKGYRLCKRCKPELVNQLQKEDKMNNIIVLFEATVKNDKMEDYLKMAEALKDSLVNAEEFIRSKRFSSLTTEGKLLNMSVWKNKECVSKWRNLTAHHIAQAWQDE